MKHDQLCSIAHNIADSIASGLCFIIGIYAIDIFGEAKKTLRGIIEINIISGEVAGESPSKNVSEIAELFSKEFPNFCCKNGARASDFAELKVVFRTIGITPHAKVIVKDTHGKLSQIEYQGIPLKRLKIIDELGRVRKK